MRRSAWGIAMVFGILGLVPAAFAAPPKPKANATPPPPPLEGDKLAAGQFGGVLMSLPDSERMFTLQITYPEVRLKPNAKMPNLKSAHARNLHQMYQQLARAERMPRTRGRSYHHHYNAFANMMRTQQMYMQGEARMAQAIARAEQQELRLLQQEYRAILNMYQVVKVTRDIDFQVEADLMVRVKDLPEAFDEKGNFKKYTPQEKAALKGKHKNLPGYESSPEALKAGQIVLVYLRAHKKPKPASSLATPAAKDKPAEAAEDDGSTQHKMQVKMILVVQEGKAPPTKTKPTKKKK